MLVIGTLYCAKGNFEFGISRIIKVSPVEDDERDDDDDAICVISQSLDPYDKKLHTDTWYYAKRCFLALAENMSKQMLILKVMSESIRDYDNERDDERHDDEHDDQHDAELDNDENNYERDDDDHDVGVHDADGADCVSSGLIH